MLRDAGWMQLPMFAPPITWRAPELSTLPSWRDAKRVAIDIECRDDDLSRLGPGVRRGGYIVGVAFSIEDGPTHYLPMRHEGGGNLDADGVLAYLRDQSLVFGGTTIVAGGQYDLDYLWEAGIMLGTCSVADVQIADCLLNELHPDYSLDAILKRRGLPGKDEAALEAHAREWGVHPKKGLWRLPAGAVGAYAEGDVRNVPALLRRQEREIESEGCVRAWELECRVLPAILRMTRRGIPVDVEKLEEISRWCKATIDEELGRIRYLTGVAVASPMNARQLEQAFNAIDFAVPHTPVRISDKTGKEIGDDPSITNDWLTEVARVHHGSKLAEVAAAMEKARDFHKLDNTYCKGVRAHLVNGRLHPTFKQMRGASNDDDEDDEGARFGRMASKHTNVQAQPIRHPVIGKVWRGIYIAEPDCQWVKGDYSQQEPRGTVHYAELCNLPGAKAFGDRYREDPTTDTHSMFAEISGLPRKDAKNVFLGLCYGMGGGLLAISLGLPTEPKRTRDGRPYLGAGPEAQRVIDQFNERVPFVRKLAYMCSDKARATGTIRLYDGRLCHFPRDASGNYDWLHKAMNRLIQGLAAIQTKMACVALDAAGLEANLTVHDEFDFANFPRDELAARRRAKEAHDIMRDVLQLSVPARPDFTGGKNYADQNPINLERAA